MESAPMKDTELGKFVCVVLGTACLHSPKRDIDTDGVWVKTSQQWMSAHRDCYEAAVARADGAKVRCVTHSAVFPAGWEAGHKSGPLGEQNAPGACVFVPDTEK